MLAARHPPAWAGRYIGLPFKERGRGPDVFDCWGLARFMRFEETGVLYPSYVECYEQFDDFTKADAAEHIGRVILANMDDWEIVEQPNHDPTKGEVQPLNLAKHRPFDCLLIRMKGQPWHVATVVAPGIMVHIEEGHDSVWDRYDSFKWRNRILEIRRHA